eukprot:9552568-Prorocentrum_lima.AAC.1
MEAPSFLHSGPKQHVPNQQLHTLFQTLPKNMGEGVPFPTFLPELLEFDSRGEGPPQSSQLP